MKRLIQFELRKIFSKRLTQLALIAVLLLSALLAFTTFQNKYAFDGISGEGTGREAVEIDKAIAARYAGILTDETVQQMIAEIVPKSGEGGQNAIYMYRNTMQSAVASRFSDAAGNWNGLHVSDVFGEEEIKIGYVDGWLSTSQNMTKIIVFLMLVLMVMIAPVFCGEYSGVDNIILSSKYGQTKCATAKVIASVLSALLVTAIVSAFNLLFAIFLYGNSGLDCSILFGPMGFIEGYIPFNITCGTLLTYQILLAFTCAISVTGITLVLSAVCKNQMVALVGSAACNLVPALLPVAETSPMFRYIGLLPMYHAQFTALMSVEQMSSGLLYAIWAIPVAVIFFAIGMVLSRKAFAKHQVS